MAREKTALLRVEGLVKRFGGFRALDRLSFQLARGEALGLVGPNGSGKTTCINVITGVYRPDGGTVLFEDRSANGLAPHLLARRGINRTFQSPRPFASLTVRENLEVAAAHGGPDGPRSDLQALLAWLDLDAVGERLAAHLTSAQQKMLDLGRALATAPKLLLVDELAAGLTPAELERVARRLRSLVEQGVALLVVEHLLGFLDRLADRVIVMNAGREIFEGTLKAAARDPLVREVFLGRA